MDKTITISGQLEQFHKELQVLQKEERKDKYILLTLAIAGMLGVYSLVTLGQSSNAAIDNTPAAAEVGGVQPKAPENSTALLGY